MGTGWWARGSYPCGKPRRVTRGTVSSEQSPAVVIIQETSPLEGPRDNSEKIRLGQFLTRGTIDQ